MKILIFFEKFGSLEFTNSKLNTMKDGYYPIKVKTQDFTMHLMQICPTIHVNKHLSHLTYGRATTKGGNPIVTRNRRIAAFKVGKM